LVGRFEDVGGQFTLAHWPRFGAILYICADTLTLRTVQPKEKKFPNVPRFFHNITTSRVLRALA